MNLLRNMTRRELLLLGKRLLLLVTGWQFLGGPRQLHGSDEYHSQLPDLIGYLLYEWILDIRYMKRDVGVLEQ